MNAGADDSGRTRYFQLQTLARRQGRDTQELLTLYALEGLLARLAASNHSQTLVLKGGMLLAAFGQRRPTRDLDVQAQQLPNDLETVRRLIVEIAEVDLDDGLRLDAAGATAQPIRDVAEYGGVRVTLIARLHTARLKVQVDVNVGDPIWPAPQQLAVPRLLEETPLVLRGYPLPMVLAEKLVTAVQRGTANTRWRDFADIYLLTRNRPVPGAELTEAVRRVAEHRAVELRPLTDVLDGFAELATAKWSAWRNNQDLTDRLPADITEVIDHVIALADPVFRGTAVDATWDPDQGVWTS